MYVPVCVCMCFYGPNKVEREGGGGVGFSCRIGACVGRLGGETGKLFSRSFFVCFRVREECW